MFWYSSMFSQDDTCNNDCQDFDLNNDIEIFLYLMYADCVYISVSVQCDYEYTCMCGWDCVGGGLPLAHVVARLARTFVTKYYSHLMIRVSNVNAAADCIIMCFLLCPAISYIQYTHIHMHTNWFMHVSFDRNISLILENIIVFNNIRF